MKRPLFLSGVLLCVFLGGCSNNLPAPGTQGVRRPSQINPDHRPGSTHRFVQKGVAAASNPVVFSFVFFGCNRLDGNSLKSYEKSVGADASTANINWLDQHFTDVSNAQTLDTSLTEPPSYLLFCGDLVKNEENDTAATLKSQLAAWTPLWTASALYAQDKTYLVPIAGNHEMLISSNSGQEYLASTDCNDAAWLNWISTNTLFPTGDKVNSGPNTGTGNADKLASSLESQMSYSFDVGDLHFIVLNTDAFNSYSSPSQGASAVGWIALNWLTSDIQTAQANTNTSLIFVFGHKPIVPTDPNVPTDSTSIYNYSDDNLAAQFQTVMRSNSKVVGYFCAHAHLWQFSSLSSGANPQPVQVIAGNAGSPLEGSWSPGGSLGPYFGWTLVKVLQDGTVQVENFGRTAPSNVWGAPASGNPTLINQETAYVPSGP